jgi:hypothetical protein
MKAKAFHEAVSFVKHTCKNETTSNQRYTLYYHTADIFRALLCSIQGTVFYTVLDATPKS